MLKPGTTCEILPGYDSETGERTNFDDVARCECEVVTVHPGGDVTVRIKAKGEVDIHRARLRPLRCAA